MTTLRGQVKELPGIVNKSNHGSVAYMLEQITQYHKNIKFCMYLLSTAAYRLKKYHNFTHKSWRSCVDCSTQQHQNISDHFIKMLQKAPAVQTKQFVTHAGWRDEADSHLCLTHVCKKLHPQHPPTQRWETCKIKSVMLSFSFYLQILN